MRRSAPWIHVLAAVAALAAAGCEGRFPVCKDNAECAQRDAGAGKSAGVCFNLRCVECRYDTDCAAGKHCGGGNTCEGLEPGAVHEEGTDGWDPNNWQECAKRCKDQACLETCDKRFKK